MDGNWDYEEDEGPLHVYPLDDLVEHELSEDCICGPDVEMLDDGTWMYAHHSLDGRERSENQSDV